MKKEDKDLLAHDLCARLPYGVKCKLSANGESLVEDLQLGGLSQFLYGRLDVLPYLRPMSSMTEEERKEFSKLLVKRYCEEDWEGHISISYCIEIDNVYTDDEDGIKYPSAFSMDAIDWLNAHHFDYRGLISKGLALEAPKDMYYKIEEEKK